MILDGKEFHVVCWLRPCVPQSIILCLGHQQLYRILNVGVSENSVPLNPMVLLIIIPIKWL